jgi:hypothetical protein
MRKGRRVRARPAERAAVGGLAFALALFAAPPEQPEAGDGGNRDAKRSWLRHDKPDVVDADRVVRRCYRDTGNLRFGADEPDEGDTARDIDIPGVVVKVDALVGFRGDGSGGVAPGPRL